MDMETQAQSQDIPQTHATGAEAVPTERTFRQSELNEIVGKVRQEARQEAIENYKRQQQSAQAQQPQSQPHQAYMPETDIRRMASEEAQRLRDEWVKDAQSKSEAQNAERIVQNFWDKLAPGKEKYEDFDKVTGNIELSRFPHVVQLLAEHVDNSHDVLYELGKNRLKMAQLEQLSYMSPGDAIIEAQRLAQSIKDNEDAGNMRQARAPLSQQRPSNVGTDAGSTLSMADLKRKYRA